MKVVELESWRSALITENGKPLGNVANVVTAMSSIPELVGVVGYDMFASQRTLLRKTPWKSAEPPCQWSDADDINLQIYLQHQKIPVAALAVVTNGVTVVAEKFKFDPLKDYLHGLRWDGRPRLSTWLPDFTGCDDSPLNRAISRCILISAAARGLSPGCKADHVLVLEGEQGTGKSTLVNIFGGEWTQDNTPDVHSKDAALSLQGRWFVEVPELAAMSKSEIEHQKKFFSLQSDKFRPPYGRNYIDQPRRCIFIATTNESRYLRDPTGNRRFWPVHCRKILIDELQQVRDQLFAEAVSAYQDGEAWHITDAAIVDMAKQAQAERLEVDPWHAIIAEKLGLLEQVTTRELLALLEIPSERQSGGYAKRVGAVMRALGWISQVDKSGGQRNVVWVKDK